MCNVSSSESLPLFGGRGIEIEVFQNLPTESLQSRLRQISSDPAMLNVRIANLRYGDTLSLGNRVVGIFVSAVMVACLAMVVLSNIIPLNQLPQYLSQIPQNINFVHLAIGCGITAVFLIGASIVIHRARTKEEPLLDGAKRGEFCWMEPVIETVSVKNNDQENAHCYLEYLDTSTLDENGHGKALLYAIKPCCGHYQVSTIAPLFGTPLVLIGAVAYNVIRAVMIPFYLAVQLLREACTGKQIYEQQRFFRVSDIPKEVGYSIWRAVKAPFYAVAFILAGLYSFANPMGGRKLGAAIERDWNEGVSLSEGFWSVGGRMPLFQFEGGGGPDQLGRNGYYLAGCWQPTGVVTITQSGASVDSMERVVDPTNSKWRTKTIYRSDHATQDQLNGNVTRLNQEYKGISKELARRRRAGDQSISATLCSRIF